MVTIETSYQQLQAEGLIYSLPKKAFFVAQIQVQRVKSEKKIRLVSDLKIRSENPKTKFNLGSNQINPETFPFATWSKLLRSVLNDNQEQLVEPSPSQEFWNFDKPSPHTSMLTEVWLSIRKLS